MPVAQECVALPSATSAAEHHSSYRQQKLQLLLADHFLVTSSAAFCYQVQTTVVASLTAIALKWFGIELIWPHLQLRFLSDGCDTALALFKLKLGCAVVSADSCCLSHKLRSCCSGQGMCNDAN